MDFDWQPHYYISADIGEQYQGSLTIMGWFYNLGFQYGNITIIAKPYSSVDFDDPYFSYQISSLYELGIEASVTVFNTSYSTFAQGCPAPLIGWNHCAMTYNLTTGKILLYLNGQLESYADAHPGGPILYGDADKRILINGRSALLDPYLNTSAGKKLSDIRFYNRVVTQTEIYSLYNQQSDFISPRRYYKMGETTGTRLVNK